MMDGQILTEVETIAEIEDIFEDATWDKLQEKLVRLLKNSLEENQIELIANRVKNFAESLIGTDQGELLAGLYNDLLTIKGIGELKLARVEFNHKDTNENLAKYKAAGHRVMRNLWQCLERYKEEYISSGDRLLYLAQKYADTYQKLTEKEKK